MNLRTQCCKVCTKRTLGCHATCEEYIAAKVELDKIKQDLISKNKTDAYFVNKAHKSKKRYMKK